jgi:hypothetical protein
MFELRTEQKNAIRMLQVMSARLGRGKALFNPLRLAIVEDVKGKIVVSTAMQNENQSSSMIAQFRGMSVTGVGKEEIGICIDADVIIDYLEENYGADEMILIKMHDAGDSIWVVNENSEYQTRSRHYLEEEEYVGWLKKFPVMLENGMVSYNVGTPEKPVRQKPETEITIDAAELQKIIARQDHVKRNAKGKTGPTYYKIKFSKSKSTAIIGDMNDKNIAPIELELNCKVDGPDAEVTVGDSNFEHIIGIMTGELKLYAKDTGFPLWVIMKGDSFSAGYLIAAKTEVAEVETNVSETGEVEVVEPEEAVEPDVQIIEEPVEPPVEEPKKKEAPKKETPKKEAKKKAPKAEEKPKEEISPEDLSGLSL